MLRAGENLQVNDPVGIDYARELVVGIGRRSCSPYKELKDPMNSNQAQAGQPQVILSNPINIRTRPAIAIQVYNNDVFLNDVQVGVTIVLTVEELELALKSAKKAFRDIATAKRRQERAENRAIIKHQKLQIKSFEEAKRDVIADMKKNIKKNEK